MNSLEPFIILAALFAGPLIFAPLEHNLEPYCFALGVIAVTLSRRWEWHLLRKAALDPVPITITVVVAGILFGALRPVLDRSFAAMRRRVPRPLLAALVVLIIGFLSERYHGSNCRADASGGSGSDGSGTERTHAGRRAWMFCDWTGLSADADWRPAGNAGCLRNELEFRRAV